MFTLMDIKRRYEIILETKKNEKDVLKLIDSGQEESTMIKIWIMKNQIL